MNVLRRQVAKEVENFRVGVEVLATKVPHQVTDIYIIIRNS